MSYPKSYEQNLCIGFCFLLGRFSSVMLFMSHIFIIYRFCPSKADAVILGCAEIGLLTKQEKMKVPIFDTTLIHAEEIALYAIK